VLPVNHLRSRNSLASIIRDLEGRPEALSGALEVSTARSRAYDAPRSSSTTTATTFRAGRLAAPLVHACLPDESSDMGPLDIVTSPSLMAQGTVHDVHRAGFAAHCAMQSGAPGR
jgi:hypothetical protein